MALFFKEENIKLANEFAQSGTVKHFALRLGFMPHDEQAAEEILAEITDRCERLELENERTW